MKGVPAILGLSAALFLAPGSMASEEPSKIYECKDARGNVVYQGDPCLEPAPVAPKPTAAVKPSKTVKPPPAPKRRAVSLPPAPLPAAPASPGRTVDAQWATPEKTLRTFVNAVKAGDRALVLACLASMARADLGPDAESLPLEELQETVRSFTGFVSEGDVGPYWSIRALRAGARPKWIFFERTGDGTFKIGAF